MTEAKEETVLDKILKELSDMKNGQNSLKEELTNTIQQEGKDVRKEIKQVDSKIDMVDKKVIDCAASVNRQEKRIDQVEREMKKRQEELEKNLEALREGATGGEAPMDQREAELTEFRNKVGLKPVIQRSGESETAAFLRTLTGLAISQELLEGFVSQIVEEKRSTKDHEKLWVTFNNPHPVNVIFAHAANKNRLVLFQHAPGDLYKEFEPLNSLAFRLRKYDGVEEGPIRTNIRVMGRRLVLEATARWSRGNVIVPDSLVDGWKEKEDETDVYDIVEYLKEPGEPSKHGTDPGSREETVRDEEAESEREVTEGGTEESEASEATTSEDHDLSTPRLRGIKRSKRATVRRLGLAPDLSVSTNDDTPDQSDEFSSSDERVESESDEGGEVGLGGHDMSVLRAGDSDGFADVSDWSVSGIINNDSRIIAACHNSNPEGHPAPAHRSLSRLSNKRNETANFYPTNDTNVKVISDKQNFILNKKTLARKYLTATNIKDWKVHTPKAANPKTGEETSLKIEFNTGVFNEVVGDMFTRMAKAGWEIELADGEGKYAVSGNVSEKKDAGGTTTRFQFTLDKLSVSSQVLQSVHLHVHMTNQTLHIQSNDTMKMWEEFFLPLLVEEARRKEYQIKMTNETVRRTAKPGNACSACGNPLHAATKQTCRQCMKSVHVKCIASGVCAKCKQKAKELRGEMAAKTPESSGFWKRLQSTKARSEGRPAATRSDTPYQSNMEKWLANRFKETEKEEVEPESELEQTEMLPAVPQPGTEVPLALTELTPSNLHARVMVETDNQSEGEGDSNRTGVAPPPEIYEAWSPETMTAPEAATSATITTTPPLMVTAGGARYNSGASPVMRSATAGILTPSRTTPRTSPTTLSATAGEFRSSTLARPPAQTRQLTLGPPVTMLPRLMGPTPRGRFVTPTQRAQRPQTQAFPCPEPRDAIHEEQQAKIALLEEEIEALREMNDTYRRASMQTRSQRSGTDTGGPLVEQTFNINCRGEGDSCSVLQGKQGTDNPNVRETFNSNKGNSRKEDDTLPSMSESELAGDHSLTDDGPLSEQQEIQQS